jgi:hypothetical protein
MKKNALQLLALTALGVFTLSSQAEGLYTYALIDAGIASTKISGGGTASKSQTEFVTGGFAPNFVGMTYEKGLQGALTAGVQLEQGFLLHKVAGTANNYAFGNGDILNRQANLYVKSSLGKFILGRQPNIAFNTVLLGDPRSGSNYGSSLNSVVFRGGLSTVDDGAIGFVSNNMNGATLSFEYLPSTQSVEDKNEKSGTRASVTYGAGNMTLGAAVYQDSKYATNTAITANASGSVLSAVYKLSSVTLKGVFASQKPQDTTTTSQLQNAVHTTGLGGNWALGADTTLDFGTYLSSQTVTSTTNYKLKTNAIGLQQKLTKELTFYSQFSRAVNKGTATADGNFTWATVLTRDLTTNQTGSTLSAGLLLSLF